MIERSTTKPDAAAAREAILFTSGEIASLLGGGFSGDPGAAVYGVTVDSRAVTSGSLFVALAGERTDGHEYIARAIEAGASCILASFASAGRARDGFAEGIRTVAARDGSMHRERGARTALVLVDSTLDALQRLARIHRSRFPMLLRIGITGSSGKTTTKECLASMLRIGRRVVASPGNLNSDVGLPLSMFGIGATHEVGVFEMGMNRAGEMGELAEVLEPDMAVITNIGTAHIGILGSRQAIAEEKKKIFARFDGAQTGFVWEDDDFADYLRRDVRGRVLEFGFRSLPGLEGVQSLGADGHRIRFRGGTAHLALPGTHSLLDAFAAMRVAVEADVDTGDIVAGLESVRASFGRMEILRGGVTLIRDCYNANPESVGAALDFCDSLDGASRLALVLGSMRELGEETRARHEWMGRRAAASRAQALFFFGEETEHSVRAAREAGFSGRLEHTDDMAVLVPAVLDWVEPGDTVLVKASRTLGLERLSDSLAETHGCGPSTSGVGTDDSPPPRDEGEARHAP